MKKELIGKITKIFTPQTGIILGNDNIEYYFSIVDLIDLFEIKLNQKVVFKPQKYLTQKQPIYKALLISKYE